MHTKIWRAFATCALLAAVGCTQSTPAPQQEQAPAPAQDLSALGTADVILSNGKIITVDDKFTIAQAVAIRGDRVIAVDARCPHRSASLACGRK